MNAILAIDPSGSGTTGFFLLNESQEPSFFIFYSKDWLEHFYFIMEKIKEYNVTTFLYEDTSFIKLRTKDVSSLFKLLGSLQNLNLIFKDINLIIEKINVARVKLYKKNLLSEKEINEDIKYKKGRGKGWSYKDIRIKDIHSLESLIVYVLWLRSKEIALNKPEKIKKIKTKTKNQSEI